MADQLNFQSGTVIAGDFRVVAPLSAGGMGAVYKAEQLSTGKQRALKVMLPQLVADPKLRERFEQEARIASRIESEHVVEVVGAGVDAGSGVPWLAMELLAGEDLSLTVARRGPLPPGEVVQIFEQLCHAVGAAHRAGIVHRDLKPENIFLAQARRAGATFMVKVLDFGIAKIVAEAKTKQTAAMGSPIWMAPEQADRSPITPATDVWALGLIAFFLLTGRFYWRTANAEDPTIPQLMKEMLFEPIVAASVRTGELGVTLPPAFDAWFGRCVVREPSARFPDASQAWAALAQAFASYASMGVPSQAPTTVAAGPLPQTRLPGGQSVPVMQSQPMTQPEPAPTMRQPSHASLPSQPLQPPVAVTGTGAAGSYTIGEKPRSRVPIVAGLLGVAFALGAVLGIGAWAWGKHTSALAASAAAASASAEVPASADMASVLEAKHLCDGGDCEAAHQRLLLLPAGSDARQSQEFKDIEFKWAAQILLQADHETDPAAKRALLSRVVAATSVDDTVRANATASLATLDTAPEAGVAAAPKAAVATAPHAAAAHAPSSPPDPYGGASFPSAPPPPAPPPSSVTTAPPAPPPPPVQARSSYDLANSRDPADWAAARAALQPGVERGTASVPEVKLLEKVCKRERDSACVRMCKSALRGR